MFQISVPEPKDVKEFEEQGGWMTHHCVLQLSYLSATEPDVVSCPDLLLDYPYHYCGFDFSECT